MDFKNLYKSLINRKKYCIIMSLNEYELLQSGKKIQNKNYSIEFIKALLNLYYKNLERIYENNSGNIQIYLKNLSTTGYVCKTIDTSINFIHTLEELYLKKILTKKEITKYKNLESLIDYKLYFKNIKDNKYEYYFEQNKKSFTLSKIIDMLEYETDYFINTVKSIDINFKEEFLILMKSFIKENIEKNNYVTNQNIIKNSKYILEITDDYDIYNKIEMKNRPKYLEKINLSENLINKILNDIPKNFDKLEQAIYIYIKLCNTLTHDEADVDKKCLTINHKNPKRIKSIDEYNNIVVCYEVIAIFAKFLDILDVNYEIVGSERYGLGHCSLNILYKNLYIKFEPTLGLFDCDLTKLKNGIRACGIKIIKSNPSSNEKFSTSIENVYSFLEKKLNQKYEYESDLIQKYRNRFNNLNSITLEKRKEIFFDEIKKCPLKPIDTIKYIKILKKVIFGQNDDLEMELIINYTTDKKMTLSYLFLFKNEEYYIYTYPNCICNISKETIQESFKNNNFNYIKYGNPKTKHLKF